MPELWDKRRRLWSLKTYRIRYVGHEGRNVRNIPGTSSSSKSKLFSRENTGGTSCNRSTSGSCTADIASTRQYFEVQYLYCGYCQTRSISGFTTTPAVDTPCPSKHFRVLHCGHCGHRKHRVLGVPKYSEHEQYTGSVKYISTVYAPFQ